MVKARCVPPGTLKYLPRVLDPAQVGADKLFALFDIPLVVGLDRLPQLDLRQTSLFPGFLQGIVLILQAHQQLRFRLRRRRSGSACEERRHADQQDSDREK